MRVRHLLFSATLLLAVLCSACGPSIYLANDFRTYVPRHKTLAILPSSVTIGLRPNQARNISPEQLRQLQISTSLDYQSRIYAWLLRHNQRKPYTVAFQDVATTNSLLRQANLSDDDMRTHSPQELAQLLGVDAVMSSSILTTKPMSVGAAVAVGVLVGVWGATNQVDITVNIHEGESSKLLWKYNYIAAGTITSSTEQIINQLMRNAARKFPYTPPKPA